MGIEELEKNLKVDRAVVAKFLEDIGLGDCSVITMYMHPHGMNLRIAAKDKDGNALMTYDIGQWSPVYHNITIPIVDKT